LQVTRLDTDWQELRNLRDVLNPGVPVMADSACKEKESRPWVEVP